MVKATIIAAAFVIIFAACNGSSDSPGNNDTAAVAKTYPAYIEYLSTAVQEHKDSAGLRFKLAAAFDSIGDYKNALLQMDSLLVKDSINFGLWFTRGRIEEDAGDTLKAVESYARALTIYPSPDAMLALANLYAEQKNETALLICTQVKRLGMGREYDAHASFIAGVYNARTGNKEKALTYFDDCIANNYTYMEAYIEKGLVYFDSKAFRDALKVFTFAATVNALDADPYYWQGRCYEMMGIKDSAALRFKQAHNLDKGSKEINEAVRRAMSNAQ